MSIMISDSYQEEVRLRLKASKIYNKLVENCGQKTDHGCDALLNLVHEAVYYCSQRSKLVMRYMGEFTLHDSEHLFRVLRLMGTLIPDATLVELSNPELALLILAAFFHDIGMAPSEDEVRNWLGVWDGADVSPEMIAEHNKYMRFRQSQQLRLIEINSLRSEGKYAQADILEKYIVTEYIRITHADRAMDILEKEWSDKIKYKDVDLAFELASICKSHNEDAIRLLEFDSSLIVSQDSFVCLPFIGVMLRLADVLDFDANRTPKVLFAHLGVKDPVSLKEWAKHRSVEAWHIHGDKIAFNATCNHPAIEAAIRGFCDYIDHELAACTGVLKHIHDTIRSPFPVYYQIPLPSNVDRTRINAKKDFSGKPIYIYRETKFSLNKEQIIDILMGTKLYGQPSVALRELVQNSIDTCKLRQKMEETWGNNGYCPRIAIRFYREGANTYLEVEDNGVGMDQDIIDKYYSKVGTSYYRSSDFLDLKSTLKSSFIPTSRFGIGVLSCFMITDNIEVDTKRIYEAHNSGEPVMVNIVGQESIFYIKRGVKKNPGTVTKLQLRSDHPWRHSEPNAIIAYIKNTVPFPPFEIDIDCFDLKYVHKPISTSDIKFDDQNDVYWLAQNDKIKDIRLEFNGDYGITGACVLGILEDQGKPIMELEYPARKVQVENLVFDLKSKWEMESNRILKKSKTFDWNPNTESVKVNDNNTAYRESRSKLALHGVEIPMSIFAHWMGQIYQHAKVRLPITMLVNINIGGEADINLNSARTEILLDEKWRVFESNFLKLVLQGIKSNVSVQYWDEFKSVVGIHSKKYQYVNFVAEMNQI